MTIKVTYGSSFWRDYKPGIISAILIFGVIGLTVAMVLVSGGQPKAESYIDTYKDFTVFKLADKSYAGFLNHTMLQAPTLQELRGCIDIYTTQAGQESP